MQYEDKMGWPQVLVIIGALVAIVLLFLADKTTLNNKRGEPPANEITRAGKAEATDRAGAPLPPDAAFMEKLTAGAKTAQDTLAAYKTALADPAVIQNAELHQRLNEAALKIAQDIAARNPGNLDAVVEAAVFHVASPNPMTGIQMLKQVLDQNPKHYRANIELGKFSMMTAQWSKARERFTTAMQAEPKRWEAPYYLGFLMQSQENFAEAKKLYEKALTLAPDSSARMQILNQSSALPQ
jgi:tetratricopeptide (TPR) repeat protein